MARKDPRLMVEGGAAVGRTLAMVPALAALLGQGIARAGKVARPGGRDAGAGIKE